MDLSLYLIEILAQQGEVNIPGLGYFVSVRASAYYNEDEAKFYPPNNTIQYDQQFTNDLKFAQFIADKKNISVTSASFFIDKYVDDLLQEIAVNDAEISGMGWLRYDGTRISFRPKATLDADPAFFGLPEINLHKQGQQPATSNTIPDLSFSFAPAATTDPQEFESVDLTANASQQQDYYTADDDDYEYEEKRRVSIWVILSIAFIVLAFAVVGLYYYKPSLLGITEKRKPLVAAPLDSAATEQQPSAIDTTAPSQVPVNDSLILEDNSTTVVKGTTGNIPADTPVTESISTVIPDDNRVRYEIQAGMFKTLVKANEAQAMYQKRGLEPKVVTIKPRKHIITLGTYYIRKEASAAQKQLIGEEKIKKSETIIQKYNPPKK